MRLIGYVRVSTDEQETARQEDAIRDWAAAGGHELVDILREPESISGRAAALVKSPESCLAYFGLLLAGNWTGMERRSWAALVQSLVEKSADGAIFYALDRASRSCLELLLLERLFARHGAAIISISQGGVVDTSTASGKLMFRMQAALAEHECDLISERTAKTLRSKHDRYLAGTPGGVHVGRPLVGWRAQRDARREPTGLWEHDPASWPRVARVAELRRAGSSYREIEAATGVPRTRIKAYLTAFEWVPGAVAEQPADRLFDASSTVAVPSQALA